MTPRYCLRGELDCFPPHIEGLHEQSPAPSLPKVVTVTPIATFRAPATRVPPKRQTVHCASVELSRLFHSGSRGPPNRPPERLLRIQTPRNRRRSYPTSRGLKSWLCLQNAARKLRKTTNDDRVATAGGGSIFRLLARALFSYPPGPF